MTICTRSLVDGRLSPRWWCKNLLLCTRVSPVHRTDSSESIIPCFRTKLRTQGSGQKHPLTGTVRRLTLEGLESRPSFQVNVLFGSTHLSRSPSVVTSDPSDKFSPKEKFDITLDRMTPSVRPSLGDPTTRGETFPETLHRPHRLQTRSYGHPPLPNDPCTGVWKGEERRVSVQTGEDGSRPTSTTRPRTPVLGRGMTTGTPTGVYPPTRAGLGTWGRDGLGCGPLYRWRLPEWIDVPHGRRSSQGVRVNRTTN